MDEPKDNPFNLEAENTSIQPTIETPVVSDVLIHKQDVSVAPDDSKLSPIPTPDSASSVHQESLDYPNTDITGTLVVKEETDAVVARAEDPVANYEKLYERFISSVAITNFDKSDLVEEHKVLIHDFLTIPDARKLVIYVDEKRNPNTQVTTSLPSQVFTEMAYFIKESALKSDILTEHNFEHKVQYGKLTKNTMESLLRIMSHVYVPIFLGNKKWPDSVRKEFNSQLHKFMVYFILNSQHW